MTTSLAIAMVGPDSLKEGYTVLLRSAQKVDSLIYATRLDALREIAGVLVPDLIILHVALNTEACKTGQVPISEIGQVLAEWPDARSIALVDDPNLQKEVEDLGFDLGLLQGVSPARLLQGIETLLAGRQAGLNHSVAH